MQCACSSLKFECERAQDNYDLEIPIWWRWQPHTNARAVVVGPGGGASQTLLWSLYFAGGEIPWKGKQ